MYESDRVSAPNNYFALFFFIIIVRQDRSEARQDSFHFLGRPSRADGNGLRPHTTRPSNMLIRIWRGQVRLLPTMISQHRQPPRLLLLLAMAIEEDLPPVMALLKRLLRNIRAKKTASIDCICQRLVMEHNIYTIYSLHEYLYNVYT